MPRYPFDNFIDVRILWSFLGISALAFLTVIVLAPLAIWQKTTIVSLATFFSVLLVLLFHEVFCMIRETEKK